MENRNYTLDIVKGLGIIFVVFGHSKLGPEMYRVIFSFHIPLFFFVSGYVFSLKDNFKNFISKKFSALIKPYFNTLLIVGILSLIVKKIDLLEYSSGTLYASSSTIPWGPLWFLPTLFIVLVFGYLFLNFIDKKYLFISSLLSLIIGYLTIDIFWFNLFSINHLEFKGLFFNLDILTISFFFFLTGYLLKNNLFNKFDINYFLISIVVFFILHYNFDYTINLNERIYDNLAVSTIQAILGIYIIFMISILINQKLYISKKILILVGQGSLFIYIFHIPFLKKSYFILINTLNLNIYISKIIAVFIAIIFPLIMLYFVKKYKFLSSLFLQKKGISK